MINNQEQQQNINTNNIMKDTLQVKMQLSDFKYIITNIGGGWGYTHDMYCVSSDGSVYKTSQFDEYNLKLETSLDAEFIGQLKSVNCILKTNKSSVIFDASEINIYEIDKNIRHIYNGDDGSSSNPDIIKDIHKLLLERFNTRYNKSVDKLYSTIGEIENTEELAEIFSAGYPTLTTYHADNSLTLIERLAKEMLNRYIVNDKNEKEFSKFLSFILRHKPEEIGLKLMDNGWVNTEELIKAINESSNSKWIVSIAELERVVNNDSKNRYSFNEDKTLIRANQGHSIKDLKMNFKEVIPPKCLYHGTSEQAAEKIIKSGLIKPMSRQMVHLSNDISTAINVGKRHGKPFVFKVNCVDAFRDGYKFYLSDNGVYLTEKVETQYISKVEIE